MIFFILLKYFPLFLQQIVYFWLLGVFGAGRGLSLVEAGRGHSLAVVCRRLTAVASLVAEHKLCGTRASIVATHVLSRCSTACGQ